MLSDRVLTQERSPEMSAAVKQLVEKAISENVRHPFFFPPSPSYKSTNNNLDSRSVFEIVLSILQTNQRDVVAIH